MNYGMFTRAGNVAVDGIIDNATAHFDVFEDAYTWAMQELEYLSKTSTYSEATDTEVRESVYAELKKELQVLMFKSVRG